MGLSGISPWSLVLILLIVVAIFGTKKLRNAGGDLGGAVKNFKKSMKDGEEAVDDAEKAIVDKAESLEGEVVKDKTSSS